MRSDHVSTALRTLERLVLPILGIALLVAVWWLLTDVLGHTTSAFPPLSVIAETALDPTTVANVAGHLVDTSRSTFLGLVLVLAVGVPLGGFLAFVPSIARPVQPLLSLYLAFPNVAFIPILILAFGFGGWTVVGLGFLTGLPYVIANAQQAFGRIDPVLVQAGAVYCAGPIERFRKVVLPASLPPLASGTRIGAGRVLMGVVIGEMFAANDGLGSQLLQTANFFDMPGFYVTFIGLLVVGATITLGFEVIERWFQRRFSS